VDGNKEEENAEANGSTIESSEEQETTDDTE
jgi:hypothetical protein